MRSPRSSSGADLLASGLIDGPEDVILDADDNLFCGTRDGRLVRISGPDYTHVETFAQIGGRPLGLALDREGRIVVCVAGMGLVRVNQEREVELLTDQTAAQPVHHPGRHDHPDGRRCRHRA